MMTTWQLWKGRFCLQSGLSLTNPGKSMGAASQHPLSQYVDRNWRLNPRKPTEDQHAVTDRTFWIFRHTFVTIRLYFCCEMKKYFCKLNEDLGEMEKIGGDFCLAHFEAWFKKKIKILTFMLAWLFLNCNYK